jgi:hypothetical protein
MLGLANLLRDVARGSDELAAATGADAPSLYGVLHALAAPLPARGGRR